MRVECVRCCLPSLAAACLPRGSAEPQPARARAPKLIVAISVDQFSSDLFDEYRPV